MLRQIEMEIETFVESTDSFITLSTTTTHNQAQTIPDEVVASVVYAKIISAYLRGHAASVLELAKSTPQEVIQNPAHACPEAPAVRVLALDEASDLVDPLVKVFSSEEGISDALFLARSYLLHDFSIFERDSWEWANYLRNGYHSTDGKVVRCLNAAEEILHAVCEARDAVYETFDIVVT